MRALNRRHDRSEITRFGLAGETLAYLFLAVTSAVFLLPVVWLISSALKDPGLVQAYPPEIIPAQPHWENFARAWSHQPMATYLTNTLLIVVPCVIGQVFVNSLVAYAFAMLRAPGKNLLFAVTLAMIMIPGIVTLVPTYIIFSRLGWVNTYLPFIVPAWLGAPFYIFLLRQFFMSLPLDLRDSARVDGAGELRILIKIIMPLSVPALATVGLFSFVQYWNDWFGPLLYINERERMTLAIGLIRFIDIRSATPWELLLAASMIMLAPVLIVYLLGQRFFVKGIAFEGIK